MTKELMQKLKEIEQKIGKNWMEVLDNVDSPDKLIKIAESHQIELSKELAEEGYSKLFEENELSEEELANIAGGFFDDGKGGETPPDDGGGGDDDDDGGSKSIIWT